MSRQRDKGLYAREQDGGRKYNIVMLTAMFFWMCKVTTLFWLVLTLEKLYFMLFYQIWCLFSVRKELWVNVQVAVLYSTVDWSR
jgi:hypothetical protein